MSEHAARAVDQELEDDFARRRAGRLLIRYGCELPPETHRELPSTPSASSRARAMEDPEYQARAFAELLQERPADAERLLGLCRARRHDDASSLARLISASF